jgi:hypothetical protein
MPFVTGNSFTYPRTLLNALLATLGARPAGALLTTPTIELYTAGPIPTIDSARADFTVADFSGYAPATITPGTAVNITLQSQALVISITFTATTGSPFVPNALVGYMLTDGAAAYYGAMNFQAPVNITQAGDFLQLDVVLPLEAFVLPV